MDIGICKLCLQTKPLIKKSHIVPGFMLRKIGEIDEGGLFVMKTGDPTDRGGRVFDGLYDTNILCAECDNQIIGQMESYVRRLIYGGAGGDVAQVHCVKQIHPDGKLKSLKCTNVDYAQFKLFLLSLLWRASISSRPEFEAVSLGPEYTEEIRKMLLAKDPGPQDKFPCLVSSFTALKDLAERIISPPHRTKNGPSTMYSWQIGQLLLTFFVSKSHVPDFIFEAVPKEDGSFLILDMNEEMSRMVLGKTLPYGEQLIDRFYATTNSSEQNPHG